ncbi:unnamed protein product [Hydatigera taeniaeformis]|uniref:Histone domain-containing protein n=1 Tax=Hydatigena taeniaeformis TaxID=6205 RepID=A0A0R3X862_HYDTA|nr:unnamed protein product [Hydatigera taeniaeformis]
MRKTDNAISIMNIIVNDIERIAAESGRLAHYNKRSKVKSLGILTAVRLLLLLPGELVKHAVSDGYQGCDQVRQLQLAVTSHTTTVSASVVLEVAVMRRESEVDVGEVLRQCVEEVAALAPVGMDMRLEGGSVCVPSQDGC